MRSTPSPSFLAIRAEKRPRGSLGNTRYPPPLACSTAVHGAPSVSVHDTRRVVPVSVSVKSQEYSYVYRSCEAKVWL